MSAASDLARPELIGLAGYSHAAWLPQLVRLHANEAPWRAAGDDSAAGLNRYPEPQPARLIERLAALYGVKTHQILATRGSDEAIDLLSRVFLRAGRDAILQFTPTFGMYALAARLQGANVIDCELDRERGWQYHAAQVLEAQRTDLKIIYICSPNNPTGNCMRAEAVHEICRQFSGRALIVIDEAYVEWSGAPSFARFLGEYETLVILRTLSKAHALAGARCGALLANREVVDLARPVLPPYCLTQPTIEAALRALEPGALRASNERIAALLVERERMARELENCAAIERVWPSDANFLMVDCVDADASLNACQRAGFIVRDLRSHHALPRSLRITIGAPEHNAQLLAGLCGA